ncbi:AMP-binding protein [Pseudonocardia sp. RS11V-5]|uniref:AMP-binding protein n=1 Tax=Pseudonocardia terrae TaxID=2905831 RepID=UPI001E34459C|nr:AMP-binding protein [Pseudonocardia terrae]MCE3550442.1 AMP-binding protein [Pseudonocardia terrae]
MNPLDESTVLPNLLRERARERPDAVFLRDLDRGAVLTYAQFDAEVTAWASRLAGLGVRPGEAVVTVLPSCPDAIALWIAASRIGAVEVPLNAAYQGTLLAHMIGNAAASVVVTCAEHLGGVLAVRDSLPELRTVVLVDAPGRAGPLPIVGRDELTGPEVPDRTVAPWDLGCILYTSGTTGPSKGVMVPWAQVLQTVTGCFPPDGFTDADHWYVPYPLFHMSGLLCVAGAALHGAEAVIRSRFSLSRFWSDVDTHGCTTALLIGTVPQLLQSRPPDPADAGHALRNVQIAPMPANAEEFGARFGVRISTVFNMTEISCPIHTGWSSAPAGAVGKQRPGYQVRIVDEHDREVPTGTVGEIVVRADLPWVLNVGYWRMPDKTAQAWVNGWFHTGDAGVVDEHGWFFFVDRKKDAIRCRGENISSMELEAEIGECPGVREVAVIGVPAELGEEDVVACVVAEGHLAPAALHAYCRDRLPAFMVPRFVLLLDALPKTPTEKVRKPVLREAWEKAEGVWDARVPL